MLKMKSFRLTNPLNKISFKVEKKYKLWLTTESVDNYFSEQILWIYEFLLSYRRTVSNLNEHA